MSILNNPYIMIAIVVLLFIAVIIRSIDWRSIAVKWVGNNANNAQIYIKAGSDIHTIQGKRGLTVDGKQQYIYQDNKERKILLIPKNYPYEYIRGRRVIGLDDEKLVANPLGFFDKNQLDDVKEGVGDISEWSMGIAFLNALKSVKKPSSNDWFKYILIGLAVVVGYFVYQNFFANKDQIEQPGQQEPAIERPADIQEPANTPVIIRPGSTTNE